MNVEHLERVVVPVTQAKPWWASKAIIGGVIASIAPIVGLSVAETAQWTDIVVQMISLAGVLLSIYGRIVAKKAIVAK